MICVIGAVTVRYSKRYHREAAEVILFHRLQLYHSVEVACDICVRIYGQAVMLVLFDVCGVVFVSLGGCKYMQPLCLSSNLID